MIQKTAKELGWRVDSLPERLSQALNPRGRTVVGSARKVLDGIVGEHENLYWTLLDGVLRFEVRSARIHLSEFDELAGRLMSEAQRGGGGRIPADEYRRMALAIDAGRFKPVDCLEGLDRDALARWNQTRPRVALHTFSDAYRHPRFHRAVLRRLNRAEEKYRKAHLELQDR